MTNQKRIIDNRNIAIKSCKHGTFMYLINDKNVGQSLDLYGEYFEAEISLLSRFIYPKSVIIEAGAGIGTETLAMANMSGNYGFVYSFEPQRLVYNLLCGNIGLNNFLNIKTFNVALSDVLGKIFTPLLDPSTFQDFANIDLSKFSEGDAIPVTTIDNLNPPKCDLIKIDAPGYSEKILTGAFQTIEKFKPVLYFRGTGKNSLKYLKSLGYKCRHQNLSLWNPENYFETRENIFKNAPPLVTTLCIPPDLKYTGKT